MARTTLQPARTKFTVPQLARQWGLDPHKVITWIRSGELRAINGAKDPNSCRPRFLIDVADIRAFEEAREVIPACPPPRARHRRRTVKQYI
jgi:hypothetical protein